MFDRAHDPLKDYLAQRAAANSALVPSSSTAPSNPSAWAFLSRHYELLHKIWIYGIAFAVTCSVINPLAGWKEFLAVPIVTVFMGAVVAVAELPTMLAASALISVGQVLWVRWRKRQQP